MATENSDLELTERLIRAVFDSNIYVAAYLSNNILACAIAGNADYLVTYDPHFDCLGGEFQGIRVVDGLHFLYVGRGNTKPA